MRYYLIVVKITSQDTEDRQLTPYDDINIATRKFHEAFNSIGGGSKKISAMILDDKFGIVKSEVWTLPEEATEPTE
jgi:hypothetical protein